MYLLTVSEIASHMTYFTKHKKKGSARKTRVLLAVIPNLERGICCVYCLPLGGSARKSKVLLELILETTEGVLPD